MARWRVKHCLSYLIVSYATVTLFFIAYSWTRNFWWTYSTKRDHFSRAEFMDPEQEILRLLDIEKQNGAQLGDASQGLQRIGVARPTVPSLQRSIVTTRSLQKNAITRPSTPGILEEKVLEEKFQPVGINKTIFVYSAYLHERPGWHEVTALVIVNRSAMGSLDSQRFTCVYDSNGADTATVQGKLHVFGDHHGYVFSPAYIACPVPRPLLSKITFSPSPLSRPLSLFITPPGDHSVTNQVPVQVPGSRQYQFLVCFSPLHRRFDNVGQVVQNLELAQILGAEHAIIYNTSISQRMDRVLRHYVSKGFLEVKKWPNPPEPIHYKGQIGAINDCLLHNRNRTEFIVFMDTDEMIVPRVHESWSRLLHVILKESSREDFVPAFRTTMLKMSEKFTSRITTNKIQERLKKRTNSSQSPKIGAVRFPSAVFLWDKLTNLTAEECKMAQQFHLTFLLKQRRIKELWEKRSKTIVNPRAVYVMGIHYVQELEEGHVSVLVNESVGLVQHYRWYSNVDSVRDTNILRFASALIPRVKSTYRELASTLVSKVNNTYG